MFFDKETRVQIIKRRINILRAHGEVKNLRLIRALERELKNLSV